VQSKKSVMSWVNIWKQTQWWEICNIHGLTICQKIKSWANSIKIGSQRSWREVDVEKIKVMVNMSSSIFKKKCHQVSTSTETVLMLTSAILVRTHAIISGVKFEADGLTALKLFDLQNLSYLIPSYVVNLWSFKKYTSKSSHWPLSSQSVKP